MGAKSLQSTQEPSPNIPQSKLLYSKSYSQNKQKIGWKPGVLLKKLFKKACSKTADFFENFWRKWNFSKIFKFDYIHQFLSYFNEWECKKHLNLSSFSNLKSTARTETFARQKVTMKKIDSLNFAFFNAYFIKKPIFMHARGSARATDKRVEKLNNCRCVLHFESSKYLKNRWN